MTTGGQSGYLLLLRRASFCRFFSLMRITVLAMPIAITTTSTMASPVSAPDTSMAPIQLFLWWLVMFSASLLAVVIFHLVMVPAMDWIVRRFG